MAGQNTGTGEKSQATQSFFIFVRDNNSGQIKSIVIPGDVQIGLDGNPSDLTLMGRFSVAAKNYDVSLTNKGILQTSPDDTIIGVSLVVTPISGRISLYLSQSPREGELHFVKDLTGTSNIVPIDVFPTKGYTIDGMALVTLSDPTASLALVFLNGNWHRLVAGLGTSGGSGAPVNASFVTINPEAGLTAERHLTGSTNILMTDHGAKATVSFDLSQILGGGAGVFTYATVTADAFGRITSIAAGATPPSANSSFLTAQNEPTLPNHRQMSGGLGTTVTDSGAGTFFEFNVDPRIVPFLTGATFSGPVIFNSGLTGSLQQLPFGKGAYIVGLGSITVSTGSNGQIILSGSGGSGGSITSITGAGGTAVSNVGGAYTVSSSIGADLFAAYLLLSASAEDTKARILTASGGTSMLDTGPGGTLTLSSSIYADKFASYLVASASAEDPNARRLAAGTGITLLDNGPGNTLVITASGSGASSASIGANLYASYLLVNPDAQDVNARTVAAGSGVTFTDGGPGGVFTISSTATGGGPVPNPAPAVAYMGHCTGSLNFGTHTAWTDLITTVPTNFFDDIQQGITRNGTTFTVNTTGYYQFHAFFNAIQSSQYIAFRLSGSNGTILQRTTWQNGGQPPMVMDGVIQLNSGSSFKLQFYDSGGSTWGVADPIGTAPDQENMRTGDVSMFLINPLNVTVNTQFTSSNAGWVTAVDLAFDNAGSQTFTGNSTVTILGYTFTQLNGGGASLAQVVPGTGVQWTNSAGNDIFGGIFSAPSLITPFQTLFPGYSLPDHDVRIWWWINQDNVTTDFDGAVYGVALGGTATGFSPATENITNKKGHYGASGYNIQLNVNSTNYQNIQVNGFENYNVQMLQFNRNGRFYAWYIGSGSIQSGVDVWPSIQAMQLLAAGDSEFNNEGLALMPITGSGNPSIFFGEASTGGRAIVESYRRLRFDYLTPSNIIANANVGLNVVTASLLTPVTIPQNPTVIALASITSSWTDVEFWFKASGLVAGANTIWYYLLVDGNYYPNMATFGEVVNNGAGFGHSFMGKVQGLVPGVHTYAVNATVGAASLPTITPGSALTANGQTIEFQGATLMLMNLTGSGVALVSGSATGSGTVTNITGVGGTLVTSASGNFTVSSSIYADLYGGYLLISASAEDPNARVFAAGSGISFTDTGPGGVFTISSTSSGSSGPDFDPWAITSPNQIFTTSSVSSSGGFTGSLTQTGIAGNPYLVGVGNVFITTNSLGQVIISGSGGSSATPAGTAVGQAAYYGFVTASCWWAATGSWTPFLSAMPDTSMTDVFSQSIIRTSSSFQFVNAGLYAFHANFNAYGSDAYISLRLNGISSSKGVALERSTYRTTPADQNQVQLDGIFSASIGDVYVLEYITSGTTFAWTGSNPLPTDGPMHTGEVSIFLLSPQGGSQIAVTTQYFTQFTGTLNALTASGGNFAPYGTWTNVATESVYVTGSNSRLFIAYNVQSRRSSGGSNYAQICIDGVEADAASLSFANGNPVLGNIGSIYVATASQGNHVVTLNFQTDTNGASIVPFGQYVSDHANLFVQEIPQITGQTVAKAPIYSIPILAGTVASNTSFSSSKQSLGMGFFNPTTVASFGGQSRRYFFRAVLDEFTVETNMSAAIDLNDYNGIVSFPPTTIPGSIMSTSSGTSLQLQAELTSLMQFVTGSGLLEARLWRTVSGSLSSIANCRNARFDVEFT